MKTIKVYIGGNEFEYFTKKMYREFKKLYEQTDDPVFEYNGHRYLTQFANT